MKYLLAVCLICSAFAKDSPKTYPLSLSVLKLKQVPFVTQAGNSSSSTCRVTGTSADTFDISCNTYQNTAGIPGVSYLMLAVASDGNTYLFGCSAQWRWSHCSGLELGHFRARMDGGRLAIEAFDKGKAKEIKYDIYEMESAPK